MKKNRYLVMKESHQTNSQSEPFPDVCTMPMQEFKPRQVARTYNINERDISRIDLLMFDEYAYANFDDLVLWHNHIGSIHLMDPGDELFLPSRRDMERFYSKFSREI